MNLTIRCCTNTTIAIVFLTTSCYSSVTLADYIKPTPECAQAQQQLKILEGRMKDDEQIVTNAQATYENVAEGVTQVDHTNVDALRQYIANKEQAFQSYMQADDRMVAARTQYYQFKDRFNDVCYIRTGPPPPAPPPPRPPAPPPPSLTSSVRIENVGDRRIYFSVVSRSNGVTRVCDVDAIDSNTAMEPSIGRCSGASIEMALHSGKQLDYYKLDWGSIYQIYWNGQEWRLQFADRR